MPHINLLAWRKASREAAKKQYLSTLLFVVIVSFGGMYGLYMFYAALKDGQDVRNNFLTSEIALLEKRIAEIRELDQKKESLRQRQGLIEELQSNRNLGTQIIDEIAKIVPPGVYLTNLERRDRSIVVVGKSESLDRASIMLENIQSSYLFEKDSMQKIAQGNEEKFRLLNDFNLRFSVKPYNKIQQTEGKQ